MKSAERIRSVLEQVAESAAVYRDPGAPHFRRQAERDLAAFAPGLAAALEVAVRCYACRDRGCHVCDGTGSNCPPSVLASIAKALEER